MCYSKTMLVKSLRKNFTREDVTFIRITNKGINKDIEILKNKIKPIIVEIPSPFQFSCGRGAVDVYIDWG